jgi:trigger factor
MQVTETNSDGLKREFRIVVPASELSGKLAERLEELGRQVRVPGFRPGKVPMRILRQRYGAAVLSEVLQSTVETTSSAAIREHNLRPALPPKLDIVSFREGADLEYTLSVELLPDIPEADFSDLDIERLAVEIPEEEVDRALARLAEQQRQSEPVDRPAESGDIIVADVEGRVEDREIPGAGGKDRRIELGTGELLPGFEEQLLGARAGEERLVRITFPADYAAADLAGKEGLFTVRVKQVRRQLPLAIDDALAQAVGLETLDELRQEVRQSLQRNYDQAARLRLKRALLDKLAERYDFPVPPGMVELEFENLRAQFPAPPQAGEDAASGAGEGAAAPAPATAGEGAPGEAQAGEGTPAGDGAGKDKEEQERAAEYRRLAERRIRLGLLLAEIGRRNNITVSQEELNQALLREARRHPGHERQVVDYYRRNPDALGALRAPILEDKVIDFIVEMAKPPVRKVTPQELLTLPEPDGEPAAPA